MSGAEGPVEPPRLPALAERPTRTFSPAQERERNSQDVLRAAIANGKAADLLDALVSGGTYGYNHVTRELVVRPRTYLSERPYDAVRVTMTNNTAKVVALAVLDPEGSSEDARDTARAVMEKLFLLAGRETVVEPVAHTMMGFEWDEVTETMESGTVAHLMVDRMDDARRHQDSLGLRYGVAPAD